MSKYLILDFPGEGLMLTRHPDYARQLWSMAKMTKKRFGDPCAICDKPIGRYAYWPLTNLSNRMMRICLEHRVGTQ